MTRRGSGSVVLAVLIGAAVGLAVAGLPDLDPPPARPVVEAADDETTSTVEPSEPSVSSDAPTTTVAESTTTSAVSTSTTTTAPARTTTTTDGGPEVVLSGVRVDVINSGSRGGTATAVAERLADEFGAEATAGDGPSLPTSYVAATPDLRRAAEVVAFLLGIDDIEFGALDGPARLEVFLGRDYRE